MQEQGDQTGKGITCKFDPTQIPVGTGRQAGSVSSPSGAPVGELKALLRTRRKTTKKKDGGRGLSQRSRTTPRSPDPVTSMPWFEAPEVENHQGTVIGVCAEKVLQWVWSPEMPRPKYSLSKVTSSTFDPACDCPRCEQRKPTGRYLDPKVPLPPGQEWMVAKPEEPLKPFIRQDLAVVAEVHDAPSQSSVEDLL